MANPAAILWKTHYVQVWNKISILRYQVASDESGNIDIFWMMTKLIRSYSGLDRK
jgi:hypothetical protein